MKNTKCCPKCGGTDIERIDGFSGIYGTGNNIPVGFGAVGVHRYLCCECGFSEEWIDKEDISKIKKKLKKRS